MCGKAAAFAHPQGSDQQSFETTTVSPSSISMVHSQVEKLLLGLGNLML
jgi:hypothetical protein